MTISVNTVETINPPMTTVARGRCTSAPADVANNPVGTHFIFSRRLHIVEMIDHKNTIKNSHTEEGYESHTGRDAERQSSNPQSHNATDERQRDSGEDHK